MSPPLETRGAVAERPQRRKNYRLDESDQRRLLLGHFVFTLLLVALAFWLLFT
jgi:hypothetical protein